MSLFKTRQWWAAPKVDEEFGNNCLCVANIDNDPEKTVKIITGSFQGFLRIYHPKRHGWSPDDLLLEHNLGAPILQVEAGRFIPNSSEIGLAVLHPKKLSVFSVKTNPGIGEQGTYYALVRRYEHVMEHTASNFVYGPFGGVYGKDYICVQSMDGQLSFFQQDSFTFSRFLDPFLLPGPLCYVAKTDSFVTCNSELEIESYRYSVLGASSSNRKKTERDAVDSGDSTGLTQAKRLQADWKANIGEEALAIHVTRFSRALHSSENDLLVLGERTLFCLKENGQIRLQKRLGYMPRCDELYPVNPGEEVENYQLIVGSQNSTLHIYKDMQMVWASHSPALPVALRVATFGGVRGMIVMLDESGVVSVNYLGTDPSNSVVNQPAELKALNIEEMDMEFKQLQAIIKEAAGTVKSEPADRLVLRVQDPSRIDIIEGEEFAGAGAPERFPSVGVRLFISYAGTTPLENVNVSVLVPEPFYTPEKSFVIDSLQAGNRSPLVKTLVFQGSALVVPISLTVTITAAYVTAAGEPRTAQCEFDLPLHLACKVVPPIKQGAFQLIFDTNKEPVPLGALFEDLDDGVATPSGEIKLSGAAATLISFRYFSGLDATIQLSKSGGRYRVQSSQFEALSLISQELLRRLALYFKNRTQGDPLVVSFAGDIPLPEVFAAIDAHFIARKELAKTMAQLNDRAQQFRAIQKRLLVRFKDRNAVPLQHLDTLLEGTYRQLLDLGSQAETAKQQLQLAANKLGCAVQVLLLLMRVKLQLDDNNYHLLRNYLSPIVIDSDEQGWEEVTDAAMCYLIRTALATSAKDTGIMPVPLESTKDLGKLKKRIAAVCDRLAKGGRLYRPPRG